jgi:hypothetical protein
MGRERILGEKSNGHGIGIEGMVVSIQMDGKGGRSKLRNREYGQLEEIRLTRVAKLISDPFVHLISTSYSFPIVSVSSMSTSSCGCLELELSAADPCESDQANTSQKLIRSSRTGMMIICFRHLHLLWVSHTVPPFVSSDAAVLKADSTLVKNCQSKIEARSSLSSYPKDMIRC